MTGEFDKHCELCVLERCTRWYRETKYFAVLDCRTCGTPMVVLKRHALELTDEEQVDLDTILLEWPDMKLRGTMRKVTDHWHEHLVPR